MFSRNIEKQLAVWAQRADRKVLVLRGARQVGKTTAVQQFAKNFGTFLYFNLEIPEERDLFEQAQSFDDLTAAMFLFKNIARSSSSLLIFVDEIQCSPKAVGWMRYFQEKAPQWHVVAAGSLLESAIDVDLYFPVGRVEYLFLKPVTFMEFLSACGEAQWLEVLAGEQLPEYAHQHLIKMFYAYAMVGGMPEAVSEYAGHRDIVRVNAVYERLLRAYIDDAGKYAGKKTQVHSVQFAVENAFLRAGQRLVFAKFGDARYGSREMSDALRTIEKAMLVTLMYPTTAVDVPMCLDRQKSPRLHVIDTGMLNFFAGVQKEFIHVRDLNAVYRGIVAEHVVGQELAAIHTGIADKVSFWVREKKQSNAQVDYVIQHNSRIIPIEVKSGEAGRLRSLHEFMDRCPHDIAVRVSGVPWRVDQVKTIAGKPFRLLNVPFYAVSNIHACLDRVEGLTRIFQ
jgi:predicted AAA+ superfamily ATPase